MVFVVCSGLEEGFGRGTSLCWDGHAMSFQWDTKAKKTNSKISTGDTLQLLPQGGRNAARGWNVLGCANVGFSLLLQEINFYFYSFTVSLLLCGPRDGHLSPLLRRKAIFRRAMRHLTSSPVKCGNITHCQIIELWKQQHLSKLYGHISGWWWNLLLLH